MKRTKRTLLILAILLGTGMLMSSTTWAQGRIVRTDSGILFHGGPVIGYGNCSDSNVPPVITDAPPYP